MRKLKFRAWNKKYKEMFSWERLLELNENNTKEGPNKTIHHEHMSLFQMILTNNDIGDRYELMQSTGLLDKNGKEIYEGDIVSDGVHSYEMIWCAGLYGWMYDDTYSGNLFTPNEIIGEIIGNIHENPELIDRYTIHC